MLNGSISTRNNIYDKFNTTIKTNKTNKTNDVIHDNITDLSQMDATELDLPVNISQSNNYVYLVEEILDSRVSSIRQTTKSYIICFEVITSALKPYIRFRLEKVNNELCIPSMNTDLYKIPVVESATYYGSFHNKDQFLFYENKTINTDHIQLLNTTHPLYWATVDDIINIKSTFDVPISTKTTEAFLTNEKFIYLIGEDDEIIETPTSGYFMGTHKQLNIIRALGIPRTMSVLFGPYYYFSNYQSSMNRRPLELTVGIVKCALFMGISKVMSSYSVETITTLDWSLYDSLVHINCVSDYEVNNNIYLVIKYSRQVTPIEYINYI